MEHELLTARQVMDLLQISRSTLTRYVQLAKLPAYAVGRDLRFRREDVLAALRPVAPRPETSD